ncbi:MAG: hypothetical protein IT548_15655 [Alphaproteobacteria bacterium]|nr:hypothetical protein [Alphaproteobacteria bacterium]
MDLDDLLWQAITAADLAAIRRLAANGASINRQSDGTPLLDRVLWWMSDDELGSFVPNRYEVVSTLLDLGANPHLLNPEGQGILGGPAFQYDFQMLKMLLERGVDPNRGHGDGEDSVYDEAEFDFRFALTEYDTSGPSERDGISMPSEAEKAFVRQLDRCMGVASLGLPYEVREHEDNWLRSLDQKARDQGRSRPDHLFLLRKFGALTSREIAHALGDETRFVRWIDDHWVLGEKIPQ